MQPHDPEYHGIPADARRAPVVRLLTNAETRFILDGDLGTLVTALQNEAKRSIATGDIKLNRSLMRIAQRLGIEDEFYDA